ncbi:hypothetical protein [Clavibacter sp. Sh2036]|uniref:hypothetical protein n=1 Tax=unclassified Clavibacter TaxID=2626594 RepID=UPI0039E0C40B
MSSTLDPSHVTVRIGTFTNPAPVARRVACAAVQRARRAAPSGRPLVNVHQLPQRSHQSRVRSFGPGGVRQQGVTA